MFPYQCNSSFEDNVLQFDLGIGKAKNFRINVQLISECDQQLENPVSVLYYMMVLYCRKQFFKKQRLLTRDVE